MREREMGRRIEREREREREGGIEREEEKRGMSPERSRDI